jgi:pantothenate synthetase
MSEKNETRGHALSSRLQGALPPNRKQAEAVEGGLADEEAAARAEKAWRNDVLNELRQAREAQEESRDILRWVKATIVRGAVYSILLFAVLMAFQWVLATSTG